MGNLKELNDTGRRGDFFNGIEVLSGFELFDDGVELSFPSMSKIKNPRPIGPWVFFNPNGSGSYDKCLLTSLVISNMLTWFFPKTPFNFASALMFLLFLAS